MKVVCLLLCLVVTVYSESCFRDNDCTSTTCSDSSMHVICASFRCTCSTGHNGHSCSDISSCRDEHCRFGRSHCVDGNCHCTFEGIFGGGARR